MNQHWFWLIFRIVFYQQFCGVLVEPVTSLRQKENDINCKDSTVHTKIYTEIRVQYSTRMKNHRTSYAFQSACNSCLPPPATGVLNLRLGRYDHCGDFYATVAKSDCDTQIYAGGSWKL